MDCKRKFNGESNPTLGGEMQMEYFRMPTKLCMGEGSLKELEKIEAKKVFIICDPFMKSSGKVNLVSGILGMREIPYQIFDKVIPDPTLEVVSLAVKMVDEDTDTIIALGGGSAIDTAKVVRKIFEAAIEKKVQFIAIPTTSGTGSELTSFAVVSDKETKSKIPLIDFSLLPDIAILDCVFTASVPASITADTGIDVLTHALEAVASNKATDFTDANAYMAVELVFQYLKRAVEHGDDLCAREHMHNASALAGIAFNEASLGICHSMAHALGGFFHIPHGRANAILLPHVMEFNTIQSQSKETIQRYARLSRRMGFGNYDDISSVKSLIRQVQNLIKSVGIDSYINGMVDGEEYSKAMEKMAKLAVDDRCTVTNPVEVQVKDLEAIYAKLQRSCPWM